MAPGVKSWRDQPPAAQTAPSPSIMQAGAVVYYPLILCLTRTAQSSKKYIRTLDEHRAPWAKVGRMNHLLCPFGKQQSWDHKYGRDHPVADCFPLCCWFQSYEEGSRSSAPRWLPATPIYSLFMLMLGRPSPVPFGHSEKQGRGGLDQVQGHRQCGFWLCT